MPDQRSWGASVAEHWPWSVQCSMRATERLAHAEPRMGSGTSGVGGFPPPVRLCRRPVVLCEALTRYSRRRSWSGRRPRVSILSSLCFHALSQRMKQAGKQRVPRRARGRQSREAPRDSDCRFTRTPDSPRASCSSRRDRCDRSSEARSRAVRPLTRHAVSPMWLRCGPRRRHRSVSPLRVTCN